MRAVAFDSAPTLSEFIPLLLRFNYGKHIGPRCRTAELWPGMASPAHLESAILNLDLNTRDAMLGGGAAGSMVVSAVGTATPLWRLPGRHCGILTSRSTCDRITTC